MNFREIRRELLCLENNSRMIIVDTFIILGKIYIFQFGVATSSVPWELLHMIPDIHTYYYYYWSHIGILPGIQSILSLCIFVCCVLGLGYFVV